MLWASRRQTDGAQAGATQAADLTVPAKLAGREVLRCLERCREIPLRIDLKVKPFGSRAKDEPRPRAMASWSDVTNGVATIDSPSLGSWAGGMRQRDG